MQTMSEYAWVISSVGLVLVFIGWQVVYFNAKKLATRSESKSAIDHLIKILNEISDFSCTYWLSGGKSTSDATFYLFSIMSKVTQSYEFVKILQRRGISISDEYLTNVSMGATLDCEAVSGFSPDELTAHAQEVMERCMSMISHIYQQFEDRYPAIKEETLEEWSQNLGPKQG
ncbi:hypothetical protein PEC730217_36520 [Pectobacterium carotovorum subsp. carotovorum]|uniref:hypothetical protein n=1 Tax=Pectobacterium versatile TaxID=2488639 RepID=UPI0020317C93|nr:hypothetical protein [Pectobacterium carotovorum]MCL6401918.1 hypothetical protein [Pectobacterium carotovorum subsp. carotovorum]GKW34872.1 hypothetical protein PEC730217_36520 [Pectobacterium carotovorum subsp. carotovorum]